MCWLRIKNHRRLGRRLFVKTIQNTKYLCRWTSAKLESIDIVSIDIIRYGATVAAALAIRITVVFKIPNAPAHRRTVRDFEARSAILVNASNIAIVSWGASNPTPLETPFIRGSTADYSFPSCSRVYLRDRIRKPFPRTSSLLFLSLSRFPLFACTRISSQMEIQIEFRLFARIF